MKGAFFMTQYTQYTLNGLPFGPTKEDAEATIKLLSGLDENGAKKFALMKIIPQESGHDGKSKEPWDVDNHKRLNWSNPNASGFMTLHDVIYKYYSLLNTSEDQYEVGMLVNPPYLFLDIDDIPDEVDRSNLSDRIKKINELTQHTYSEISVSGQGLHFLFKGNKQPKYNKKGDYEFYGKQHWVALTRNIFLNKEIKTLSDTQIDSLQKYLWGDPQASELNLIKPVSTQNSDLDKASDEQLIDKIRHSANAVKFNNLWNGGNDGFTHEDGTPDPSAGDASLCDILVFWTGHDAKRVDSLFRQSPRYKEHRKDKWDAPHYAKKDPKTGKKETYGHHIIHDALEFVTANYTGSNGYAADHIFDSDYKEYGYATFESNAELIAHLKHVGKTWLQQNPDKNGNERSKIPDNTIIDILCQNEQFRRIYASEMVRTSKAKPLYYYDWDLGIYSNDDEFITTMIQAVDKSCTSQRRQKDVINSLKTNPRHPVPIVSDIRAFKKERLRYVHVKNGIFDLKLQKLLPASPDYAFTSYINTNYNEDAFIEPHFNSWSFSHFLKQIAMVQQVDGTLKYDQKKYRLLWEIICAAIIGATHLRKAIIFVDNGQGRSGKSTLLEIIRNIVGADNTAAISFEDMADPQNVARAENKILIASDENETGIPIRRIANLNKLVTGDPITLKRLYENSYDTVIHAFIIEASNSMPKFPKAKQAVFARLLAVKFNVHFDPSKAENKKVIEEYADDERLQEWILYHCLHDVQLGASLTETQESHELLSASNGIDDPLNGFVPFLRTIYTHLEERIPAGAMYTLYCGYFLHLRRADNNAGADMPEKPLTKNAFTAAIRNNDLFNDLYDYHRSMRLQRWDPNGLLMQELKEFSKDLPAVQIKKYKLGYTLTEEQFKKYNGSVFQRKENK